MYHHSKQLILCSVCKYMPGITSRLLLTLRDELCCHLCPSIVVSQDYSIKGQMIEIVQDGL